MQSILVDKGEGNGGIEMEEPAETLAEGSRTGAAKVKVTQDPGKVEELS